MQVDLFDFELPNALIALRPANPRDAARLLYVGAGDGEMGKLTDCKIADLPQLVRAGDALIINNTKVIPARLSGRRVRGPQNNDKNNTAKI
ncbi:MAG: S-adenosylmethionine:tRNA ribosyltransferase-isomerase, partial [Parvibaculales bacterium]